MKRFGLVSIVVMALAISGAGFALSQTGDGEIYGTVTALDAKPLSDICVFAFPTPGPDGLTTVETRTNTDGGYVLAVSPGTYQVQFVRQDDMSHSPGNCSSLYASEFFDDVVKEEDAAKLTVLAGGRHRADASLSLRGGIVGTVTDASGRPLPGIFVDLLDVDRHGGTITDAQGRFTAGVGPGNWSIYAFTSVPTSYAPATLDNVQVDPGSVVTVDLTMPVGATVSGQVTDEPTGEPVGGVSVSAVNSDFRFPEDHPARVMSQPDGGYVLSQLPPGTYTVDFRDDSGRYVGAQSRSDLNLGPGDVATGIDAALTRAGFIAGTVSDAQTGFLFEPACVEIFDSQGVFIRGGNAGGPGYVIGGIPAGDHFAFADLCEGANTHLGEWYLDSPNLAGATPIRVTAEAITYNIDFSLERDPALGGNVQGRIADLAGRGIWVTAQLYGSDGAIAGTAESDPVTGEYWMSPVPAGMYRLKAVPHPGQYRLPIWYGNTLSPALATPIEITAGRLLIGIEMQSPWIEPFDPTALVGLIEPNRAMWHTIAGDGSGASFYYGLPGDVPLLGDWDGDGESTPGMFRPGNGFAYIRNSNTTGAADLQFFFGLQNDIPLSGDWDGDGYDTFGIYRPGEGKVYLSNALETQEADVEFYFGMPGDRPVAGDFDGNGVDEVGLYRESDGFVYIRLSQTTGFADLSYFYGDPRDSIVAGDWDGDGADSLGVYRPSERRMYLRNENSTGVADVMFEFWRSDATPVS